MVSENISYEDAIIFKKNNCYTTALSFSDVVNSQLPISEILKPNTSFHEDNFPGLYENHHFFNSGKTKFKPSLHQKKKKKSTTSGIILFFPKRLLF